MRRLNFDLEGQRAYNMRSYMNARLFLIILMSLSLCVACGQKEEGHANSFHSSTYQEKPILDLAHEILETVDLETIDPPSPANPDGKIITTFFDKKYNRALLDELLKQSNHEISYIKSLGVDVYVVDEAFTSSVPSTIKTIWNKQASKSLSEGARVGGMHISKGFQIGKDVVTTDVIMLAKDYNQQVVMHEFLHYLFDLEDKKSAQYTLFDDLFETYIKEISDDLQKAIRRYSERHKEILESKEVYRKDKIGFLLSLTYELMTSSEQLSLFMNQFLEESIICSIILNQFLEGKILLTKDEVLNNLVYADKNIDEAKKKFKLIFDPLTGLIQVLQEDMETHGLESLPIQERFKEMLKQQSYIASQMKALDRELDKLKDHPKIILKLLK